METLYAVQNLDVPTLWFWPNADAGADGTSKGIRAFREVERAPNIRYFKNMIPDDFLRLLYNSYCIVGNSSVGIRECSFLGVPAVNIGTRQVGRERGRNVLDVDYDREQITDAIQRQLSNGRFAPEAVYGDGKAGGRIAHLLATAPLRIEKRLTY
jgi:UDP-N-acetylglucosamine 2-epimerase